ncbi:hypothetical protein [Cohnella yongneupensis]|uniref:Group II intron reverse transcriptase/maturase n=1 Tax=Cohnella yongneupensis TaxID=425006 RepID=A0ABW0R0L0_9BACL
MNQELKLKWHSIYGQILFDRKLHAAWLQVKENKGAGGIDGETLESYEKLDENLSELLQKLRDKAYVPSPVRRRYIPKKNGKMRPLGIPQNFTIKKEGGGVFPAPSRFMAFINRKSYARFFLSHSHTDYRSGEFQYRQYFLNVFYAIV